MPARKCLPNGQGCASSLRASTTPCRLLQAPRSSRNYGNEILGMAGTAAWRRILPEQPVVTVRLWHQSIDVDPPPSHPFPSVPGGDTHRSSPPFRYAQPKLGQCEPAVLRMVVCIPRTCSRMPSRLGPKSGAGRGPKVSPISIRVRHREQMLAAKTRPMPRNTPYFKPSANWLYCRIYLECS